MNLNWFQNGFNHFNEKFLTWKYFEHWWNICNARCWVLFLLFFIIYIFIFILFLCVAQHINVSKGNIYKFQWMNEFMRKSDWVVFASSTTTAESDFFLLSRWKLWVINVPFWSFSSSLFVACIKGKCLYFCANFHFCFHFKVRKPCKQIRNIYLYYYICTFHSVTAFFIEESSTQTFEKCYSFHLKMVESATKNKTSSLWRAPTTENGKEYTDRYTTDWLLAQ